MKHCSGFKAKLSIEGIPVVKCLGYGEMDCSVDVDLTLRCDATNESFDYQGPFGPARHILNSQPNESTIEVLEYEDYAWRIDQDGGDHDLGRDYTNWFTDEELMHLIRENRHRITWEPVWSD